MIKWDDGDERWLPEFKRALTAAVKELNTVDNTFHNLNFHDVEGGIEAAATVETLLREGGRMIRKAERIALGMDLPGDVQ